VAHPDMDGHMIVTEKKRKVLNARQIWCEQMTRNFPVLAAKNDRDMKWKKFLYKQLCQREGIYICRAPSCEVCADYAKCFGPEERME